MPDLPVILARDLVKSYGPVEAVRGIDLDVPAGSCIGLLGPNGAGKTTTMRMIMGSPRRAPASSPCSASRRTR